MKRFLPLCLLITSLLYVRADAQLPQLTCCNGAGGGAGLAQGAGTTIADEQIIRGDTSGLQGSTWKLSDAGALTTTSGGISMTTASGGPIALTATGTAFMEFNITGSQTMFFKTQGNNRWTLDPNGVLLAATGSLLSPIHVVYAGSAPTVGGSCGVSPAIAGKDGAFQISAGTGAPTSCTATFNVAWSTAPLCVANSSTTTAALNVVTTTTTVTVSAVALTAGETINVLCQGF